MGELRKPQCSKERRFFPTPSPIRRMALGGTFALILWFVVINGIPPAHGTSSIYLPLVLKPPTCDPAMTLTTGNEQIIFGTPGDDHICEYGYGNNVTQYAEGSAGNDTIFQDCRGANTCDQTAIAGDGNDTVAQYGGSGKNTMFADGGTGSVSFFQDGGPGDDVMEIHAGAGQSVINQLGGSGNDTMKVTGSTGDDTIKINAGDGNDTLTYIVSSGTDVVHIDGGPGDDTLTINKNQKNFTLFDNSGNVIFKSGDGGSTITVTNIEHIKVIGDNGTIIFQWDAP